MIWTIFGKHGVSLCLKRKVRETTMATDRPIGRCFYDWRRLGSGAFYYGHEDCLYLNNNVEDGRFENFKEVLGPSRCC